MTYYYETEASARPSRIDAETDEEALKAINRRRKASGATSPLMIVYEEVALGSMRAVWERGMPSQKTRRMR